mgnify:FL=1
MSPLTLLEAQLMEKPVIATRVGGIPELMRDTETGFLVEKGDSSDLIEKITLLLANKGLCEKMGKDGRKFVIDNFSWEIIGKKFLQIVKEQIN